MNLLLDSHALIWFLEDDPCLSKAAKIAISDPNNTRFVSDATAWEMAIKHSLGKLRLPLPYESLFPETLENFGFLMLPIMHEHFYQMIHLPRHHGDPFDRLLIAQAMVENLTIISRDPHFSSYGVPLLW